MQPAVDPVPLSLDYVAISVSLASGCGCPYLLPLFKARFLDLSPNVGKRYEGIRAAAWKVRRILCTSVCRLIPNNLCVSWHPLYVDLNIWSYLEDIVEVVDYSNGKVLSCCCNWREGPSDGCLVVHNYPDGVCLWIPGRPPSGIVCCLEYAV